jgi:hypothetical protein
MLESLSTRGIWYFVVALLIMGAVVAAGGYLAAEKYIASAHEGDPLQKQGGLSPDRQK